MSKSDEISTNLKQVRETIEKAAVNAQRNPTDISLVAVSKTHPSETIQIALELGQRVYGE